MKKEKKNFQHKLKIKAYNIYPKTHHIALFKNDLFNRNFKQFGQS
jgi:hypothetical protein